MGDCLTLECDFCGELFQAKPDNFQIFAPEIGIILSDGIAVKGPLIQEGTCICDHCKAGD